MRYYNQTIVLGLAMRSIIRNLTSPLLMASIAVIVVVVGVGLLPNTILNTVRGIFGSPPVTDITTSETIVTGIKPLGQLVSVEAQVAKAGIAVHIQRGVANACQFTAQHVAQGTLQAGIDLTQITEASVRLDEAEGTYYITLPHAQLTSCSLDPVQTQQYSHSGDLFPLAA